MANDKQNDAEVAPETAGGELGKDESAAPEDDEDAMTANAKGIAEQLLKDYPGVSFMVADLRPKGVSGIPKPTLGTLRELAHNVAKSFEHCVARYLPMRRERRENGAVRGMLEYVSRGTGDGIRKHVTAAHGPDSLLAQLSDTELADTISCNFADNTVVAAGLGIWVGFMLAHTGLKEEEVIECACDPVFIQHLVALRVNKTSITKVALDVLADVHKARSESQKLS